MVRSILPIRAGSKRVRPKYLGKHWGAMGGSPQFPHMYQAKEKMEVKNNQKGKPLVKFKVDQNQKRTRGNPDADCNTSIQSYANCPNRGGKPSGTNNRFYQTGSEIEWGQFLPECGVWLVSQPPSQSGRIKPDGGLSRGTDYPSRTGPTVHRGGCGLSVSSATRECQTDDSRRASGDPALTTVQGGLFGRQFDDCLTGRVG